MTPKEAKLDFASLARELAYDPETGKFIWKISGKGRDPSGYAGTVTNKGYLVITFNYERYIASRLAWRFMTENWPKEEIDHINGNTQDNRFGNLREASHQQNLSNLKTRNDNTSGYKGVCWDKQKSKWKVQVGPSGHRVQRHFIDIEDAKSFYDEMSVTLFGEFANA